MAAHESLSGYQFRFEKGNPRSPIGKETRHKVVAETDDGDHVGDLEWYSRGNNHISHIEVEPNHRRQGVATGMFGYAHEVAKTTRGVQPPKHSPDRTNDGDAWAKSTGKRVPKRLHESYYDEEEQCNSDINE
jgi:GNAT superfamily N-acetyltransferase